MAREENDPGHGLGSGSAQYAFGAERWRGRVLRKALKRARILGCIGILYGGEPRRAGQDEEAVALFSKAAEQPVDQNSGGRWATSSIQRRPDEAKAAHERALAGYGRPSTAAKPLCSPSGGILLRLAGKREEAVKRRVAISIERAARVGHPCMGAEQIWGFGRCARCH